MSMRQQPLPVHIEQLCAGGENSAVEAIAAKHEVVDVELFGDAVSGGAGSAQVDRDSDAVVGPETIFARHDVKGGRIKAFLQEFGERIADPLDARGL